MNAELHRRAEAAGIEVHWNDAHGEPHTLGDDTVLALLDTLAPHDAGEAEPFTLTTTGAPLALPAGTRALHDSERQREHVLQTDRHGRTLAPSEPGYYQLHDARGVAQTIAVAPHQVISLADLTGQPSPRSWGVAAQVYGLRRPGDGGLGDSLAVAELAQQIASEGGDALALSPLHASAPADRAFSPYTPSHRGWLDTMQIAPAQIVGEEAFRDALAHSGQAPAWATEERRRLIDWPIQDSMRHAVWQTLAQRWGRTTQVSEAMDAFVRQGGRSLQLHALFAARQRIAQQRGESIHWQQWEPCWRATDDPGVAAFAAQHTAEIAHEYFAQWLAESCWQATRQACSGEGRVGLIWDLATGFDPGGSEAWQQRELVMQGVRIGAPPDGFNAEGQDWGLGAYAPNALRRHAYRPLRELLSRMMSRGGGLRIDHILGLARLWVIPAGMASRQGGYVRYPLNDMLGVLALESWRHRCMVIGEDLGTVPPELRDTLAQRNVLGIDVLQFTRDPRGRFLDPLRWRNQAVAMSSTHDLPPLEGWRSGTDIDALAQAQSWDSASREAVFSRRAGDIAQLDRMLERFAARSPRQAALQAVAESPAPLALIPLEDVLGEQRQPNLPGTLQDQHPNWRRRLGWRRPRLNSTLRLIGRYRKTPTHA